MISDQEKKFIVYKSSAGSGKTFTLVREYLKIVLEDPQAYRQVLAVTFTNKAANEMKDRVVRNLIFLADPETFKEEDAIRYLLPQLMEQLSLTGKQIALRSAQVLRLIMHNYAEFSISTIDSFTHRVIRTFAHDLKIPLNFEVELETENMLSQAVDLLINQVGSRDDLTRVMVDFVEKKAGDELNWQIEKDLNEFGKTLLNESSIEAINEIRKYDLDTFMQARKNLLSWKAGWEKKIRQVANELVILAESEQISHDVISYKERGVLKYLQNLAKGRFDGIKPNSYARNSLEKGEWLGPKAPVQYKSAFDRISDRAVPAGKSLIEMLDREISLYTLCGLLLDHLFSTALLVEIERALDSLCTDNNKLLISEFNRRISEIVREQPAPFIYERLGERYHHYLIDEFQDTSVLQWHNLLPLIENSLASARMNLIVGDAKQAIYRWRSGDAEQFEMLPKLVREKPDALLESREQALVSHFRKEDLSQNHRSSPVIVGFNNRLFSCIAPLIPAPYGEPFKSCQQETAKKDKPGLVRIEKMGADAQAGQNYEEFVLERTLSVLNEIREDRYNLRDVAILCRENKKAALIAAYLVRNEIPVISSESLLLTQSGAVNFLVAWMQFIVDPKDSIAMAHILQYLISCGLLKDNEMEAIFKESPENLTEKFHGLLAGRFPAIVFARLRQMDVFGLVQYLVYHFHLNENQDGYLRFFQDTVLEFIRKHRGGLAEFLEWWEDKSLTASVIMPEGINAVKIMTIHKAKGLQFPVVIYPFADDRVRPVRKKLWVSIEESFAEPLKTVCVPANKSLGDTVYKQVYEDEINRSAADMANVLYVALTRPEERLYVILKEFPESIDGALTVNKMFSRFFMEEGNWEANREVYQYGERWQRTINEISGEETGEKESPSCRESLQLLLRHHAPVAWDMENPEKNREWGNLVHSVFSLIHNPGELAGLLQGLIMDGLISPEQQQELSLLLDGIISDPQISALFDPGFEIRNEPEIMTKDGHFFRPDRVMMKNGKVIILDYKTGKPKEEHRSQVMQYAALIREMDLAVDSAFLLYLNREPQLVKLI